MKGKEIRAWAWEAVKTRKGLLMGVFLIAYIPRLLEDLLLGGAQSGDPVTAAVQLLLRFLHYVLLMGVSAVAVEEVCGRGGGWRGILRIFDGGIALKAASLGAARVLLDVAAGSLPVLAVLVVLGAVVMVFPVTYLTLLYPGKGFLQTWGEGVSTGCRKGLEIALLLFWVRLPAALAQVLSSIAVPALNAAGQVWLAMATAVGVYLFVFWYLSYGVLAEAQLARQLFGQQTGGTVFSPPLGRTLRR